MSTETVVERKEIQRKPRQKKPLPKAGVKAKELPAIGKPENTVMIGDKMIEIKPTKVLYQRNRTAAFYKALDLYPLPEIMAMTKEGIGDDERDGDKCVMDWLIAATDDADLILENYDDMDTETIETILEIFKRVNRVTEKEERLKKSNQARGEMA